MLYLDLFILAFKNLIVIFFRRLNRVTCYFLESVSQHYIFQILWNNFLTVAGKCVCLDISNKQLNIKSSICHLMDNIIFELWIKSVLELHNFKTKSYKCCGSRPLFVVLLLLELEKNMELITSFLLLRLDRFFLPHFPHVILRAVRADPRCLILSRYWNQHHWSPTVSKGRLGWLNASYSGIVTYDQYKYWQ